MSTTPPIGGKADPRATARHLYEVGPLSQVEVASQVGVSVRTLKRWAADDAAANRPWRKLAGPAVTAAAHQVADRIAQAHQSAKPATERERAEIDAALRLDASITERADLLAQHRRELRVVVGLLNEALKQRDEPLFRMANSAAKTLAVKQRAERLAWGLDRDDDAPAAVIIERCSPAKRGDP